MRNTPNFWPPNLVSLVTTRGSHQAFLSRKEAYSAKSWAQGYHLHLTVRWGALPKDAKKGRAGGGLDLRCWWLLTMHSDDGLPLWGAVEKRKNWQCIQFRRNLKVSLRWQQFLGGILHETGNVTSCDGEEIPVWEAFGNSGTLSGVIGLRTMGRRGGAGRVGRTNCWPGFTCFPIVDTNLLTYHHPSG